MVLVAGGVLVAVLALFPSPASAANSPTFRDCSLILGIDPDFVQLYGVSLVNGALTVPLSNPVVQLQASESATPSDQRQHVKFNVAASASGTSTNSSAGTGTGSVVLSLDLPSPAVGRTYTITWAAVFDSGFHACPAPYTPANTRSNPHPFVVTVAS